MRQQAWTPGSKIDINFNIYHLLTQVTVHAPTVASKAARNRTAHPSRASLQIPAVQKGIADEIATFPPPQASWSVDDKDRLLTKLFRTLWFKHGIAAPSPLPPPHSPWITAEVWDTVQQHAAALAAHSKTLQTCLSRHTCAMRFGIDVCNL